MPNLSDLYPIWLKAEHLPPDKVVTVTISAATIEELHPQPTQTERKLVLAFKGKHKRLVINSGNANRLAGLLGDVDDISPLVGLVIDLKRVKYTARQDTIVIVPPATNGKPSTADRWAV